MATGNLPHDRQSEPAPTSRTRAFPAIEAIEDMAELLRREPRPPILHDEAHFRGIRAKVHVQDTGSTGVAGRVLDEVVEELFDSTAIRPKHDRLEGNMASKLPPLAGESVAATLQMAPDEVGEVERFECELHGIRFEPGQVEEIPDQAVHPPRLLQNVSNVHCPLLRRDRDFRIEESLREPPDGGERSGEIVGDVRQELLPLPFGLTQPPSRLLEPGGHLVEGAPEGTDLVTAEIWNPGFEFPGCHPGGVIPEDPKSARDAAKEPEPGEPGEKSGQRDEEEAGPGNLARQIDAAFEVDDVHMRSVSRCSHRRTHHAQALPGPATWRARESITRHRSPGGLCPVATIVARTRLPPRPSTSECTHRSTGSKELAIARDRATEVAREEAGDGFGNASTRHHTRPSGLRLVEEEMIPPSPLEGTENRTDVETLGRRTLGRTVLAAGSDGARTGLGQGFDLGTPLLGHERLDHGKEEDDLEHEPEDEDGEKGPAERPEETPGTETTPAERVQWSSPPQRRSRALPRNGFSWTLPRSLRRSDTPRPRPSGYSGAARRLPPASGAAG